MVQRPSNHGCMLYKVYDFRFMMSDENLMENFLIKNMVETIEKTTGKVVTRIYSLNNPDDSKVPGVKEVEVVILYTVGVVIVILLLDICLTVSLLGT